MARAAHAIRADCDEAVRQHVRKETTATRFGTPRSVLDLSRGRLLVRERDAAILQREEAIRAHGHPNDVRSTRAEGGLAMTDGLRVNTPVFVPSWLVDAGEEGGLFPWIAARGPAEAGERLDVDEERVACGQPLAIGSASASGNARVDVRMGEEVAGPGMEPAPHPKPASDAPRSGGQDLVRPRMRSATRGCRASSGARVPALCAPQAG